MRADWTASGACTSGSTAPPRGATRRASGGAATTNTSRAEAKSSLSWGNCGTGDLTTHCSRASFPASVFWRPSAALRCQRGCNDRLVRVHAGEGRDASLNVSGTVIAVYILSESCDNLRDILVKYR